MVKLRRAEPAKQSEAEYSPVESRLARQVRRGEVRFDLAWRGTVKQVELDKTGWVKSGEARIS